MIFLLDIIFSIYTLFGPLYNSAPELCTDTVLSHGVKNIFLGCRVRASLMQFYRHIMGSIYNSTDIGFAALDINSFIEKYCVFVESLK